MIEHAGAQRPPATAASSVMTAEPRRRYLPGIRAARQPQAPLAPVPSEPEAR